jgi:hypothetical protein
MRKFPCIFPVIREFVVETGLPRTASSASQSSLRSIISWSVTTTDFPAG